MRVLSLKRLFATAALVALSACASRPVTTTAALTPAPEPVLASVLARNFGAYDAGVFAVLGSGNTVWLTNVPAGATRMIPVTAQDLQVDGLVLRVQAIGSGHTWTSRPTLIDGLGTGVLDLASDRIGNPAGTLLRVVPTQVFNAEMR